MLAQQENKTAGLAGKKLPAGTQVVSFEAEGGDAASRMQRVRSVEGREPAIFAAYREGVAMTPEAGIRETISQPVSFDAVEKAQALINDAAVRISKREGAALEVTIKPDAGTELSLHIRFHAGQIEARAVCQRGDYAALQSDWPELQERLSRQGIKLSGLETPGQQAFTGFTGQNPGQRRSAPDMAPELTVFAPLTRNSKPTTQAARRVSSGNAWETWA
jgi:flagellar hook-length control protein FliK